MSIVVPVTASPTVSLSIDKRFGFAMFSDISGTFTLVARVSSDVVRVEFYLDDQLKLNDTSPPFQWDFDTTEYSLGLHTFKAMAYNDGGESANASTEANFVESPMPPYHAAFLVLTIGSVILLILIIKVIPLLRRTGKGNSSTSKTLFVHTELQQDHAEGTAGELLVMSRSRCIRDLIPTFFRVPAEL
jgi:hypothetical protein